MKLWGKQLYHIPIFCLQKLGKIVLSHSHDKLYETHGIQIEELDFSDRKGFSLMQFNAKK